MPTVLSTVNFISNDEVPKGKFATYARIVCKIRPQKAETHRTRLTVGGNLIRYLHNVITPTSDISTVKYFLNSVIFTPNEKLCGAEIKDFYSNTPMNTYKYMRIKALLISK